MKLSWWKITAIVLASLIGLFILLVLGYVLYVVIQYDRIEDNQPIDIENNSSLVVSVDDEYTVSTFNIGFGAYDQEFDFFMDSGQFKEEYGGKPIKGSRGKAISKDHVLTNTQGAIDTLKDIDIDFMFYQEVDTDASRSYHVNQYAMIRDFYKDRGMGSMYASNFHTAYLMYPFNDPHGKSNAGIATLSKYKVDESVRRSYPVSGGFAKFFDLDRCFMIHRLPMDGTDKELVLINTHMSAYDEGGVIRAKQLEMLNGILKDERDKGNYVVVGGDFNHDIADSKDLYKTYEVVPDESVGGWLYQLHDDDLAEGFRFATDRNPLIPTCRCCEMPYEVDEDGVVKNYCAVLDGFIVSDNIEVVKVQNIGDPDPRNQFKYSDHQPVTLTFRFIK